MSNESSHDEIFIGLGFGGGMGGAPPPPLTVNSTAPYDVMMSQHHHYQHAFSTQFQQQYVDTQTNHLPPNVSVANDGTSQPIAFTRGQTQNDTFPYEEVEANVGDQQDVNNSSDIEVQNRAKSIFEKLFRETEVSITVKREEVTTAAAVDRSHLAMANNVVSNNTAVAIPYAPSTVSSCIIPPQTMVPSSNPSSATAKAQAIAQRLYQQAPSQEQTSIIPSMLAPPPLSVITTTSTFCSNNAAKKRQECFQREQQRHFRFYLQNLEYLTKRDDELYQKQLQEIEQAHNTSSRMNSLAERHRQQQLQQQRKKQQQSELLVSKAGIGTSQRRKNEAVVKRKQGGELDRHTKRSENSVYVAGLKNATKDTEEKLRHLFSAFGKIQRITLYKNANTGKYKGDALVIYQIRKKQQQEVHNSASDAATEEEDTAVTSVCSQVSTQNRIPGKYRFTTRILTYILTKKNVGKHNKETNYAYL